MKNFSKSINKILSLILVLLFLAAVGGCGTNDEASDKEENKPVPVSVAKVEQGDISNKSVITGKVKADSEVMIIPKIGGKVTKVTVDVGSKVKKGDLLVQLDTTELAAQLKQAQAALELAKGSAAQNDYRIEDAKNNLERMKNLYEEGAVSKQQYELALLQYNLAVNTPSQAQVQQAQGNVDYIKAQLDNASIESPISGEISSKNVEVGSLVGPSAPVMTVVKSSKVYVEGSITESDIPYVKTGQKVQVSIDAVGSKAFEGVITALSPAADARTKGYQVKVEIDNADGKIKPGMFAEIKITTKEELKTLVIPKEALVSRGTKTIVFVVKDKVVQEREVTTGLEDNELIQITKGLSKGEDVVVLGQHSLTDNTHVVIKS